MNRKSYNYSPVLVILGLFIHIHFCKTFTTVASENKVDALYSLDTISFIRLKVLMLLF